MAKFTRVMKFKEGFHTISHEGQTYKEELEETGLFEAPHAHADHFRDCGFAEDFADEMNAARQKHAALKQAAAKAASGK